MNPTQLWQRFGRYLTTIDDLGLSLDISRMTFDESFLDGLEDRMSGALSAMEALERGGLANPDEKRMVGHYWLRAPDLAPAPAIRASIKETIGSIKRFADEVHNGLIKPEQADGYYVLLVIGIGGSALGPQFVSDALGTSDDPMIARFIDNTDPDGIDRTLAELEEALPHTLTIVISKSGGTAEPRNAMLEVAAAYHRAGLQFASSAVAITCDGSALHQRAVEEQWLQTFPMWDWIGGRTSETSAVGLLPAALQGLNIDELLEGAALCDVATRNPTWRTNPAALLAAMWLYAAERLGRRNMVVIPYRDRLALFSRYLQQLVMESLGKEFDRTGRTVHQGLTVYGNKGSTDQHAYIQQLRDGPNDFFANFLCVRHDRAGTSMQVEEQVTAGDYLRSLWQGTRRALYEKGRESITITLEKLGARQIGGLIALFERAVGLYAELIDVNAYNQPGVEAGKQCAAGAIALQRKVLAHLVTTRGTSHTVDQIAHAVGAQEAAETVFHILEHAAANPDHGVVRTPGSTRCTAQYGVT